MLHSIRVRAQNLGVKVHPAGTSGPNAIHQLIAPNAWRLPFERV
jgi:glucose-6-phosphate 1-dehydrogenase